jgi:hypothetical protein
MLISSHPKITSRFVIKRRPRILRIGSHALHEFIGCVGGFELDQQVNHSLKPIVVLEVRSVHLR